MNTLLWIVACWLSAAAGIALGAWWQARGSYRDTRDTYEDSDG